MIQMKISTAWMHIAVVLIIGLGGCAGLPDSPNDTPLPPPESADPVTAQLILEGNRLFTRQNLRDAAMKYQAALDALSSLGEAHYNLGLALYKRGLYREARPHFKKAAQLEPFNKVIRNAPPFRAYRPVQPAPEKESHDGHYGHHH